MAGEGRVQVDGLKELVRDLRKVEHGLPGAMRQAMLPISQSVVTTARARGQSLGGVQAHAVKRGLRGGATRNTAWIKLAASREPTILGAEFGGGHRPTTRQFPPWRGSGGGAGYFVYPTIRGKAGEIAGLLEAAVRKLIREAGFR
jgi:hypothetical protein